MIVAIRQMDSAAFNTAQPPQAADDVVALLPTSITYEATDWQSSYRHQDGITFVAYDTVCVEEYDRPGGCSCTGTQQMNGNADSQYGIS